MAIIEGLGSIAQNFSQGYRQARSQKTQESLQQQQLQYEHANRLFQMADGVSDPKMKDALFSSATQLLDSLDKPQKKDPKGIGAMIGSMFGIGHHAQSPAPSEAATPLGPANPSMMGVAPPPVAPDSQTFGTPGEGVSGPELQAKPQLPAVPQMDAMPSGPDVAKASMFKMPTLGQPGPVAPPPVREIPATTPQPVGAPGEPASRPPLTLPMSTDIVNEAKMEAERQFPDALRQGNQRAYAANKLAIEKANANAQKLLDITDQHLAQNDHLRTVVDASRDPEHGAEFRQVMGVIGDYESRGLLPKGTLENWQKLRFQEPEKYNPSPNSQVEHDANGNAIERNPNAPGGWSIIGERKAPSPANAPQSVSEYKFYSDQAVSSGQTPISYQEWLKQDANLKNPTSAPPTSVAEYNFYAAQTTKAGKLPISYQDWLKQDANLKNPPAKAPEMSADQLASWVTVGKTNPEMLKKLSAKDYATVVSEIQRTGGVQPAEMDKLKATMRDDALDSAKWLRDNFAPGAVGVKGPASLFGIVGDKPMAGTAARDFTDKFETFKNQIVLPNLGMLHGLGRVTDREFQALQSSINAIDRSMSETQFKSELNKVIDIFEKMKTPSASPQLPQVPGGIILLMPDGITKMTVPDQKAADGAIGKYPGAKIVPK